MIMFRPFLKEERINAGNFYKCIADLRIVLPSLVHPKHCQMIYLNNLKHLFVFSMIYQCLPSTILGKALIFVLGREIVARLLQLLQYIVKNCYRLHIERM